MRETLLDIIEKIFNGFLFTIGAILALLLAAWLGFNPFK